MPARDGRPPDPNRRLLDPGWRERHIRGQADGTMPPGKIPLTYEDGTPVLDRLGRQRWWSNSVEAATRPRPAEGWPGVVPPDPRASRSRVSRAEYNAMCAADPSIFTICIPAADPNAPPIRRPPSSREIARRKAKAEEATRVAAAARALAGQVQRGIRPPANRLWGVDAGAMIIVGPAGAIGTSAAVVRILAPLAVGGRHVEADVAAAGGCRDVVHLREVLAGMAGKLGAVGLRVDRRKAGIRMTKILPTGSGATGS